MRNQGFIFLLLAISLLFFTSCGDNKKPIDTKKYKEPLIKVNKYLVNKDYESIKSYTERHGLNMQVTETGLWYEIMKDSSLKRQKAVKNAIVIINYKVKLLNSKICYSSDSIGPKSFKIGYGGVEPGLEEGILMMRKGDKARFIMPPHLAHGLLGDSDKIPARATIIYEVELVDLIY